MFFQFIHSTNAIPKQIWDDLNQNQALFCNYAFLTALEESGSVGGDTGWLPHHLVAYQDDKVIGILPMYEKSHSYGEYVFDFAWAEAYQRYHKQYYPKLICAIPFTPVTGIRLLSDNTIDTRALLSQMYEFIKQQLPALNLSSIHFLFPAQDMSQQLQGLGAVQRKSVQFQWFNRDYQDFHEFLATFTARRRKSVRKERQKIAQQGLTIKRFHGDVLTSVEMDFFYHCYCQTYLKRSGHSGYLSKSFFSKILATMADKILLVIASQQDTPVAGALYLYDQQQLCGRYWGAMEEFDGLHFECCYYQGIEFCIEKKITSFNPGTQGEHKILRGFEPIFCYSNHWLHNPSFQDAVSRFVEQESPGIEAYKISAAEVLPFKKAQD
ncbi:GNAT family N-acetyltransferase [Aliiglaciecola sp. 3_MG-2023]|uniref:GNAT family N-acetyltransferase n=1 Tax=Aliiglaciecola sp. 3_MG-2023 TaxID=3062644 RepID=UPI0026E1B24F|nr:GNAT family N-acetyltransferase [Aliiglaciecola sp. 3_MG-2023]MDO6693911.1 GNAT family N-acetyltransferase [Aliiglaciecola sp. 3_MG-2023]